MDEPPVAPLTPRPPAKGGLSSLALDIGPLRTSREFRLLFIGQSVSFAGTMITSVAIPFQAYALTHSSLTVGLVSLVEIVPILLMAFVGGALADVIDRRRMVLLTEIGMVAATGALVVNASVPHPQLWVLFVAVAIVAGIDALQRPSLNSLVPRIVERGQIRAAVALHSFQSTMGMVAGPALAGLLIAAFGLSITYGVDVASYSASLVALMLMRAVPRASDERVTLRALFEGLRYARRRQDLLGTYLIDMNAMFFGMPSALFPQIAAQLGGPAVLGLLYMSPSLGSLLATATSGWTSRVHHHGRAIAVAASVWGIGIIGFGFAPNIGLAILGLVVAGAADMISGLFRQTVWNRSIPDTMRGRMAGIEMVSFTSGPTLGNVEAAVVSSLAGVRASVVSGGVLCVVGTLALSAILPRFWAYTDDGR